jgi:hypothetical protein
MAKSSTKEIRKPHVDVALTEYLRKQPRSRTKLQDIQKSLSRINVSLSQRIMDDREKR